MTQVGLKGQDNKQGNMEEEAKQLLDRLSQMTGQARYEEEDVNEP